MRTRSLGVFSVMWVPKLLLSLVRIRIFAQKRPNSAWNWHFWSFWAKPCRLTWCPVGGLVGGCGARADSRKTPNYFTITLMKIRNFGQKMAQNWHICPNFGFIWPNIGIFGTFDPMADQKTMPTRCLVCPLCGYHDFRLRFLAQNWLNFSKICFIGHI